MRLLQAHWALLLLATCAAAQNNAWSWNQPNPSPEGGQKVETGYDLEAAATDNAPQNATDVEKVIDEILGSQRQGRALQGYDEVYSDPNVQEALQKGDDGEARNVIKDRLCYLGLMQVSVFMPPGIDRFLMLSRLV